MKMRAISMLALIAYGAVLIKVMVFKSVPTIHAGVLKLNFAGTDGGHPPNFVPFKTIVPYLLGDNGLIIAGINLVGNIIFLVPVGLIVPLVHARTTWKQSLTVAIITGLVIETLQAALSVGIFDIDDVILNALGVMIGYWAFVFFGKWMHTKQYLNIAFTVTLVIVAAVAAGYVVYPKDAGQPMPPEAAAVIGAQQNVAGADLCGDTRGTGEIITSGNNAITVKLNNGVTQVFGLTKQTTIKTPAGVATESDLKAGDRVTLVVLDRATASAVLVCGPAS